MNLLFRIARLGWVLSPWFIVWLSAQACTIFFLTDTNRTLFCNNEDWWSTRPQIWFVPGGKHYGCGYVGFLTQVSQGGCNTEGLAFDWVAGYRERWARSPKQRISRGIPHERMLETCATVEEAIAFYRAHWEPSFRSAKMLVADRHGAAAVLGAHEGRFEVQRGTNSDGFGYGRKVLKAMIRSHAEATLTNAAQILQAARQPGAGGTKYSNVFDLNSGGIFLFLPGRPEMISLDLSEELKRGSHWYEMARIDQERAAKPKRLSRVVDWILTVCCPLRYSRPTASEEPRVALLSPKDQS